MDKLDRLIEQALEKEDAQLVGDTAELGYFALGFGLFRGKHAWVTWVVMVVQTVMFAIGVWCAIHFFQASEMLAALKWGISGATILIMGINLKLSLVPQMQADRIIREIKRVELMLASRNG